MNEKKHFLFLYDIHCPKVIRQIVKLLEGLNSMRIQYSVYELYCEKDEVLSFLNKVSEFIDLKKDKIALIPLCESDFGKTKFYGLIPRQVEPLPDFYIL